MIAGVKRDHVLAAAAGGAALAAAAVFARFGGDERAADAAAVAAGPSGTHRVLQGGVEEVEPLALRQPLGGRVVRSVTGRVLVHEPDGVRADASGRLTAELCWARESRVVEVPFEQGLFTLADERGLATGVRFLGAELDGVRAPVWRTGAPLDLDQDWLQVAVNRRVVAPLTVVSAATDAPLADVEVVVARGDARPGDVDPGPLDRASPWLARGATSPVPVAGALESLRGRNSVDLFVRAPGHAWKHATLALDAENRVALAPGGALNVVVEGGVMDDHRVEVLLSGAERAAFERAVDATGAVAFDGVPAGEHRVRVPLPFGTPFDPPLAEARVEVRAGEQARVVLTLGAEREVLAGYPVDLTVDLARGSRPRRLGATVLQHAPDGRSVQRARVALHPRERGGAARAVARLGEFPPGSYSVRLPELAWVQPFEVVGPTRLDVAVPAPQTLVVTCVDAETGAALALEPLVAWSGPAAVLGDGDGAPQTHLGGGRHRVRVPPGELTLELTDPERGPRRTTVPVAPGTEAVTARFPSACAVLVRFEHGGEPWPGRPAPASVRALPVDGVGRVSVKVAEPGTLRLWLTAPGEYRLPIDVPAGFAPLATRSVTVAPGAVAEVVVPLERR